MVFTAIVFVGLRLIVLVLFPSSVLEMPLLLSPIDGAGTSVLVSAAVGLVVATCRFRRPRRETISGLIAGTAAFTILWWLGLFGFGASFLNWLVFAHFLTLAVEVVAAGWLAISASATICRAFERSNDAQVRHRA